MPYVITDSRDRRDKQFLSGISPDTGIDEWTWDQDAARVYSTKPKALSVIKRLQDMGYDDHISVMYVTEDDDDEY